ncbi:transcriptional regulator [Paenibacillus popilliae ATCC 14706]|uniref:Trehalose operon repressor n=2 Tax=Paenibacillus popilliae TaxID=78057 RepID=M9LG65_PAEPP|nr:transcriptional regulator [Paenibacillus popilliae ATCC 14706]
MVVNGMKGNKFSGIYYDLVQKIQSGEMKSNHLLPSEHELAKIYDASRETIRKALNQLSQNGYIHKVRGKGSVVLDIEKFNFPISGLVSFKEIATLSRKEWRTIVHELVLVKPDSFIQKQLKIDNKTDVWKIVRTREVAGERIILDIDYVNKEFLPTISKDIVEHSLYEYFELQLGLIISFAKKEIMVEQATEADREYMDLGEHTYVVVIRNHVYLNDAALLQYTESRHRPDKFRFIDFARREKIGLPFMA